MKNIKITILFILLIKSYAIDANSSSFHCVLSDGRILHGTNICVPCVVLRNNFGIAIKVDEDQKALETGQENCAKRGGTFKPVCRCSLLKDNCPGCAINFKQ